MNTEEKFLIDTLTKNLIMRVMEDFNVSVTEAMSIVYNSQLYDRILDLETGLYYQSKGYNYQLLHHEICIFLYKFQRVNNTLKNT